MCCIHLRGAFSIALELDVPTRNNFYYSSFSKPDVFNVLS
jgi:hypothetical protein